MSPPLLAAVALLGVWMLMMVAVTNTTGVAQWRAEQQSDARVDDPSTAAVPASDD